MKREDLIPFAQVLEEELQDPEFRAAWERLAPARAVAHRLIGYRAEHGLTQSALGRLLGMSQPAIARLETGEHLPTLPTLLELAAALDLEILVSMTPRCRQGGARDHDRDDSRVRESFTTPGGTALTIAIR
jgi:DNA-binding XRE family transcriptional regulator